MQNLESMNASYALLENFNLNFFINSVSQANYFSEQFIGVLLASKTFFLL